MSAGKGDTPRPVDGDAFRDNYDEIFHKHKTQSKNKAMTESDIQSLIRQQVGNGPVRLFRNNVGATKDAAGRLVRFGLAKGSADLIGWVSREITPEDVGENIAQFVSIEVKSPTGKPRPDQIAWQNIVNQAGGLAGIARSVEDAEKIISPK